ncbi:HTH-type transcriptional repressor GlcR [Rhodoplanes serenus]|uniref:HTH-type transcriptional repressor GlcR n=1 Tax=Rhodoplanes serenus TaxID=200615 RepID=A0A3S4F8Z4_9BRAD|nr:DeoR/GlpR family DNA-binding transcription regulator [Rhodoplanes serenus]VCU08554.1 HTH-type transcriptional repressor GlcR [Rhodoplanes serenus]
MLRDERMNRILGALKGGQTRRTSELAAAFGVSEMTLRRDLDYLDAAGLIRRLRGGAVGLEGGDPGFGRRAQQNTGEKRRIGRAAAALVQPGASIYLDAGTTALEVGRALVERARTDPTFTARITTPAVNIGAELAGIDTLKVHQLGGQIDPTTMAVTGATLVHDLGQMNFDLFFMGITGIDPDRGLTNSSPFGVEAKRTALARTRETWVVADHGKWRQISAYQVAALGDVAGLIVDVDPADPLLGEMAAALPAVRPA